MGCHNGWGAHGKTCENKSQLYKDDPVNATHFNGSSPYIVVEAMGKWEEEKKTLRSKA
jgi:hypothetical protein